MSTRQIGTSLSVLEERVGLLAAGLTVGIAGAGVNAAAQFETAWAGVEKAFSGSGEKIDGLKEDIRQLALHVPVAVDHLAELAMWGRQMGGMDTAALQTFVDTMAKLEATTNVQGEEGVRQLTTFLNLMGETNDSDTIKHLGNDLAYLGVSSRTTDADILNLTAQFAGYARAAHFTSEQTLGYGAAIASLGTGSQSAATAVGRLIQQIDQGATDSSPKATKAFEEFARAASMSTDQFKQLWSTDAAEALRRVIAGLHDAAQSGADLTPIMDAMGEKNLRNIRLLESLAVASYSLNDALKGSAKGWNDNNQLEKEAEARFSTFQSQLVLLKNQVYDVAITMGDKMIPALSGVTAALTELLRTGGGDLLKPLRDSFAKLATDVVDDIRTFATVFAAAFTAGGGSLAGIVQLVTDAVWSLDFAFNAVSIVLTGMAAPIGVVLGFLTWFFTNGNPVVQIARDLAIAVAIVATSMWAADAASVAWEAALGGLTVAETLTAAAALALDVAVDALAATVGFFSLPVLAVIAAIAAVILIFTHWHETVTIVGNVLTWLGGVLSTVGNAISSGFLAAMQAVQNVLAPIAAIVQRVWDGIVSGVANLGASIARGFAAIWDGIVSVIHDVVNIIESAVAAVFLTIVGVFTGNTTLISQAWHGMWANIFADFENIINVTLLPLLNIGAVALSAIVRGMQGAWATVSSWLMARVTDIGNFFTNLPATLLDLGQRFIGALQQGAQLAWYGLTVWLPARVTDIIGFFGGLYQSFLAVGQNILDGIKQGVLNGWASFRSWFEGMIGEPIQWARDILHIHSPSGIFAEIGSQVVAGFQQGVAPLGSVLNGGVLQTNVTMSGAGGARGGALIGSLTIYASDRAGGEAAAMAFNRRMQRLGMLS